MKLIHTFTILFLLNTVAFSQKAVIDSVNVDSISFIHENFGEALARAKKENKILFVDAYTVWCRPCKVMNKTTFVDEDVVPLFNKKFVNLKMDMEKGDGPQLAQRYNISAYPTLLFLTGEGDMLHKVLGFQDAEQFLSIGKSVLLGENTLQKWGEKYEANACDTAFLRAYATVLSEALDPHRFDIIDEYLSMQPDWKTPVNLAFIYKFTEGADSKLFPFLVKNQTVFQQIASKAEIEARIETATSDFLLNEKKLPRLSAADSLIRLVYPPKKGDSISRNYRLKYYRMKGDKERYAQSAVDYLRKYNNSPDELNDAASTFYEQIDDKNSLSKAVKWAKRTVKLEGGVKNQLLVAQLYNKLGNKEKAQKEALKVIEMAKKTGESPDEAVAFLKEIKSEK